MGGLKPRTSIGIRSPINSPKLGVGLLKAQKMNSVIRKCQVNAKTRSNIACYEPWLKKDVIDHVLVAFLWEVFLGRNLPFREMFGRLPELWPLTGAPF